MEYKVKFKKEETEEKSSMNVTKKKDRDARNLITRLENKRVERKDRREKRKIQQRRENLAVLEVDSHRQHPASAGMQEQLSPPYYGQEQSQFANSLPLSPHNRHTTPTLNDVHLAPYFNQHYPSYTYQYSGIYNPSHPDSYQFTSLPAYPTPYSNVALCSWNPPYGIFRYQPCPAPPPPFIYNGNYGHWNNSPLYAPNQTPQPIFTGGQTLICCGNGYFTYSQGVPR
ncbi:hypothetical protein BJ875DRAFT_520506 [Amylocarpus encephaloides]|uniref:Uncharacterized protein n=1 Tax=Amylocarpus encephaloides TaxID=45428 RepID=A0A9P8C7Z8_9HELO|nr:hypothetical protein BJ875DRAFT_520506 [Amylocarpus encephaloides]